MNFSTSLLPYLENTEQLSIRLSELGHRVALESSNFEHPNGRWSIISAAPIESLELTDKTSLTSVLTKVHNLSKVLPKVDSSLPFCGGLIGHISYDLGIEKVQTAQNTSLPLLLCGLYTWAYLIDHQKKETTLVYWSEVSQISKRHLENIFIESTNTQSKNQSNFSLLKPFSPKWDKAEYKNKIDKIHNYILNGDTYQVNLAQSFSTKYEGDSIYAFSALKNAAKVPLACFFESESWSFASATPELFLQLDDDIIRTKPIKGTRPRLKNKEADQQQILDLKNSIKDKAENLMIVDLLRNDLSKNASNVKVESLFEVESFSTVHHLVSTITANIESNNSIQLLIDAFPGGSITGAPKKRAMEIIAELEQAPRSFYCGSTFYLSSNNKMNSNILIRGFLFNEGEVTCWAGGGIVADSKWEDEYQESLDKISKLMRALSNQ
ncbi:MAG: anthranilate synthase component I family protein [Bermanella sp.]